jgi:signal transduction histidine kinase
LNHPEHGFFDQDQLRLLMTLGSEVATAIVNAELYSRINEQAQRLAEMLSYQQGFVSVVSHELRTPLTAILGYAHLLGRIDELSPTQQECVDVIQANVARQMDLINDLTDISRLETGQLTLSPEPLSFPALVQEVVQSARIEIERKRLRLQVQIPEELPSVYADRKRILQVLGNLVSNAYKYTREEGEIAISAHVSDGHLQVDVRDNGVGISNQDQKRLFTRFFRADNALRDQVGGTGLGLVIAKSFVELHGGTMWVESKLDIGSTFSFTLPLFETGEDEE